MQRTLAGLQKDGAATGSAEKAEGKAEGKAGGKAEGKAGSKAEGGARFGPAVRHALDTQRAVRLGDYSAFFTLYQRGLPLSAHTQ